MSPRSALPSSSRLCGAFGRLALTCLLGASAGWAQAPNLVQINEVNFTTSGAPDAWIEVANFGTTDADVGGWSIFQATHTAGLPGAYWWGFPTGTRIPARSFLRVRWLRPIEAGNTNPLLIDTGDTSYHFLFTLRGEPLSRTNGALGLVASKNGADMALPAVYRDFVVWGNDALPYAREDLAVANGRWVAGARTLAPADDQSLALISTDLAEPTRVDAYYRDLSPTPGRANHTVESASPFGAPCVLGLGQPSQLSFLSLPIHGNTDFRVVVDNLGSGPTALALVVGLPDDPGTPWVAPCTIYVDLVRPYLVLPFSVSGETFAYRPPLDGEASKTLGVQVVALRADATVLTGGGRVRLATP